jgi:hypothetical protein
LISKKERNRYNNLIEYNGQAYADKFVLNCTNFKRGGYFLELGSRDAKWNNNSYVLEKSFGWKGIMVDRDDTHKQEYQTERPNSVAIIEDATRINYKNVFEENKFPLNLDFWQLDLEVRDNTALETFLKIDQEVLDYYKFATVTMEHDIFRFYDFPSAIETQDKTRQILESRGYYCVFKNILDPPAAHGDADIQPYEDWWVHPDLVDMEYIKAFQKKNEHLYKTINIQGRSVVCFKSYEIEY